MYSYRLGCLYAGSRDGARVGNVIKGDFDSIIINNITIIALHMQSETCEIQYLGKDLKELPKR